MLKKFILLLFLVAPLALVAQDKIAYVSSQEIMSKMPELSEMETKMATKQETIKKTLEGIQAEYQTKLEEYGKKLEAFQKGDGTVSESELMDNQKNLTQVQERYETFAQSSQAELEKFYNSLMAPLQEKVLKAIKTVGDEQGYTYIIDRPALLYVSPSAVDASKHVKTKLGITQ